VGAVSIFVEKPGARIAQDFQRNANSWTFDLIKHGYITYHLAFAVAFSADFLPLSVFRPTPDRNMILIVAPA
jgi:hypothetical protein